MSKITHKYLGTWHWQCISSGYIANSCLTYKKTLCDYISSGARWPSGLEHWLGLATWLSRPGSDPFYPALPVYFGGDIKSIGPFYVVSMAMGSKTSHQSSLERVTTTHSKLCPPEVRLCSRKRCSALVSEEDRRTCPSGTWSFIL